MAILKRATLFVALVTATTALDGASLRSAMIRREVGDRLPMRWPALQ